MAAPSLISATWFPAHQRTTATSLSLLSVSFGVSISFVLGEYKFFSNYYNIASLF
jgi:hypothetical protein